MLKDQALQVLRAGMNLKVSAGIVTHMVELARAAKASNVNLTIVGSMLVHHALEVAAAGGKNVTLDTSK